MWRFLKGKRHLRASAPLYTNWRTAIGQRTLGPAIDRKCGPPQQKSEREERLRKTVALEKPDKTPFILMADAFCPRPGT